jgi:hypothetical protein
LGEFADNRVTYLYLVVCKYQDFGTRGALFRERDGFSQRAERAFNDWNPGKGLETGSGE